MSVRIQPAASDPSIEPKIDVTHEKTAMYVGRISSFESVRYRFVAARFTPLQNSAPIKFLRNVGQIDPGVAKR